MGGKRFLAILLLITGGLASAEPSMWERIQIHGFASQGVVQTSDNNWFGDSPNTSFDFTEIGLNASFQLDPRILLSAQILARRAGEMYDGAPSLDYALVDFTFVSSTDRRFGARLGRIKNPLGLYNETRDVPFTRPTIFLPQVVYFDKVRNLFLSSDGAMLYADHFGSKGNLSVVAGGGQPVIDNNVEWAYLAGNSPGELEPDGITWIGSLWYTMPDERFKVGLSGATGRLSFDQNAFSVLGPGKFDFSTWIASIQYNSEKFTLSAEYARNPAEWKDFGPFFPLERQTAEGYYLQGAYRLLPDLQFTLRYEEGYADRDDRSGNRASALTGGVTPPFDWYSKIFTAGLRWDILPNLMVEIDYSRHRGTFVLSSRENPDPSQLEEEWDMFAAQMSLRF